jgi:hypothetical protein
MVRGVAPLLLAALLAILPTTAPAEDLRELSQALDKSVGKVLVFNGAGRFVGNGSGYAVSVGANDEEIYFLTNDHVVARAASIQVAYGEDNKIVDFQAVVLKTSAEFDMALLRLTPRSSSAFMPDILPLADYTVEQGDEVFAIGFPAFADSILETANDPASYEPVLTSGIIGKRFENTWVQGGRRVEMLQHNAAINGGNSGGPLVNRCAAVVGLNTAKASDVAIQGGSLSSSPLAIADFLRDTAARPIASGGRCTGRVGVGGWTTQRMILLGAGVAILLALAGAATLILRTRRVGAGGKGQDGGDDLDGMRPQSAPFLTATFMGKTRPITGAQLQRGLVIGRGAEADIQIDDISLSRVHAKLILRDRKLQLQDVGSTNGTRVDGAQLPARQPVQINTKSLIQFGNVTVTLARASR